MTLSISFYDGVKYHGPDFNKRDADFYGNGVINPATSQFPLTYPTTPNMTFNVGQGVAWVDGYRIVNDNNAVTLTVSTADTTNPRIDIVQLGHDDINSTYSLVVKKGVAASSPIEPGADTNYIKLYAINVAANATSITSANVTDRRALLTLNVSSTQVLSGGSASTGANTFTGTQTAPAFASSGLTGATAVTRYVGGTTSGAPTTGTFNVGDFVIDQTGAIWICTVAGTPGTWKASSPSDVAKIDVAQTWSATQTFGTMVANAFYSGTVAFNMVPETGGTFTMSNAANNKALFQIKDTDNSAHTLNNMMDNGSTGASNWMGLATFNAGISMANGTGFTASGGAILKTGPAGATWNFYAGSPVAVILGGFTSAGTQVFSVDANGNIAGGQSTPSYGLHLLGGAARIQGLATPTAPTITPTGTAGTTSYTYYVVAKDRNGNRSLVSTGTTTSTGNATLSGTNYNAISWSAIAGAVSYDVLKGNTSTLLGNTTGTTFNDTGQATSAYTAPTHNETADLTVDGNLTVGGIAITAPKHVQARVDLFRGNFSGTQSSNSILIGTAGSSAFVFHASEWTQNTFYTEIMLYASSGGAVYAGIWDWTSSAPVAGSEISTTASGMGNPIRSGGFSLTDGHAYTVYYRATGTGYIQNADILQLL